jgi:hypothetical protein
VIVANAREIESTDICLTSEDDGRRRPRIWGVASTIGGHGRTDSKAMTCRYGYHMAAYTPWQAKEPSIFPNEARKPAEQY